MSNMVSIPVVQCQGSRFSFLAVVKYSSHFILRLRFLFPSRVKLLYLFSSQVNLKLSPIYKSHELFDRMWFEEDLAAGSWKSNDYTSFSLLPFVCVKQKKMLDPLRLGVKIFGLFFYAISC